MFLVFYRQIDKPNGPRAEPRTTVGVSWGIFVAFLLGALLAYAGWRMHAAPPPPSRSSTATTRARHAIEGDRASVASPPDPRDAGALGERRQPSAAAPSRRRARRSRPRRAPAAAGAGRATRRPDGQFEGQMSFDDNDAPDAAARLSAGASAREEQRQHRRRCRR